MPSYVCQERNMRPLAFCVKFPGRILSFQSFRYSRKSIRNWNLKSEKNERIRMKGHRNLTALHVAVSVIFFKCLSRAIVSIVIDYQFILIINTISGAKYILIDMNKYCCCRVANINHRKVMRVNKISAKGNYSNPLTNSSN